MQARDGEALRQHHGLRATAVEGSGRFGRYSWVWTNGSGLLRAPARVAGVRDVEGRKSEVEKERDLVRQVRGVVSLVKGIWLTREDSMSTCIF